MKLLSNDISNWVKSVGGTETAYVLTFRNSADGGEEQPSPTGTTTTTANADTGGYWQNGRWFDAIASNLGSWLSGAGNIFAGIKGNSSGNTTQTNTGQENSEDESNKTKKSDDEKTTTIIIIVAVLIVVILAVFLLMRKK